MIGKAVMRAKGIRHVAERPLQILLQRRRIGHILRHFAHAIQIVRETDEARWNIGNRLKRLPDHRGARDLAKRTDMRQARRAIAGFKQHIALFRGGFGEPFDQFARFFKGPGFGSHCGVAKFGHGSRPRGWFQM